MFLPNTSIGLVSAIQSQNGGFTSIGDNNESSSSGGDDSSNIFNISNRNSELNILSSSPNNDTNLVNIAFGTDTHDLYIWNGSAWSKYLNDS